MATGMAWCRRFRPSCNRFNNRAAKPGRQRDDPRTPLRWFPLPPGEGTLHEKGRSPRAQEAARYGKRFGHAMTHSLMIGTLAVALLSAQAARAAIHTVRNLDDSGDGSLRQAIKDASDRDSIVFGSDPGGESVLGDTLDGRPDVGVEG